MPETRPEQDQQLVLRLSRRQLGGWLGLFALVYVQLAVRAVLFVSDDRSPGEAMETARDVLGWFAVVAALVSGVLLVVASIVTVKQRVVLTSDGVTLYPYRFRTRRYAWTQIQAIEPTKLLGSWRVRIRLVDGRSIWVPVLQHVRFLMPDPAFSSKVAEMQRWHTAHTGPPSA